MRDFDFLDLEIIIKRMIKIKQKLTLKRFFGL